MPDRPLKIYIFYCSNSLDIEDLRQCCGQRGNDLLKTVSLPCSGKLELIYLLKTFETGADGAVLITCPKGECRHLEGNLRAHKRAQAVRALLEETGLGRERMQVTHLDKEGAVEQIAGEIEHLCTRIRNYASSKTVPVGSGTIGAAVVPKN
ncbi:MAG: hydrogenase iron-sulfur subunit [Desulfobacterales bacterium]|nr:MAG: hydrogenase iron-sulfur subunit [Desulfobacterales bacterium]